MSFTWLNLTNGVQSLVNIFGVGASANVLTADGLGGVSWQPVSGGAGGTVTSVNASVPSFLSISGGPITSAGTLAIGLSGTALAIANGGTGATSINFSPYGGTYMAWDYQNNAFANSFVQRYEEHASSVTIDSTSAGIIRFTGTTATLTLPSTSSIQQGKQFQVKNSGSGAVTINSSGGNLVKSLAAGTGITVTCILASGTSAASWVSI